MSFFSSLFNTIGNIGSLLTPWGAVANGVGSIMSSFGQQQQSENYLQGIRETNAQNYKIWQEQMAHNLEMWELQRQNEWDMWNAENSYNSASEQRKRLEEAGYNPMLAIGGMSGNVAGSMSTPQMMPSQAPTMQAPGIEGYYNGTQALGDSLSQIVMSTSELFETVSRIKKNDAERLLSDSTRFNTDEVTRFLVDTHDERVRGVSLENDLMKLTKGKIGSEINNLDALTSKVNAETTLLGLEADEQRIVNAFMPFEKWQNMFVQIKTLDNQTRLTDAQIENLISSTLFNNAMARLTEANAFNQEMDNELKANTFYDIEVVDENSFMDRLFGTSDPNKVSYVRTFCQEIAKYARIQYRLNNDFTSSGISLNNSMGKYYRSGVAVNKSQSDLYRELQDYYDGKGNREWISVVGDILGVASSFIPGGGVFSKTIKGFM